MKIRKILAAAIISAAVLPAMMMNVFAAQDVSGLSNGTAYLNINDDQWSDFEADWQNVRITGDGTYTVSMTGADNVNLAQFNALEIVNGEVVFGRTYTVTIDSVKVNGLEKKSADGYTCSADAKAITTRVNIYNEWNSPDETQIDEEGNPDCRAADGDISGKSAKLISDSDLIGVQSIVVTFTVSGIDSGDDEASGAAEDSSVAVNAAAVGDDESLHAGLSVPAYTAVSDLFMKIRSMISAIFYKNI